MWRQLPFRLRLGRPEPSSVLTISLRSMFLSAGYRLSTAGRRWCQKAGPCGSTACPRHPPGGQLCVNQPVTLSTHMPHPHCGYSPLMLLPSRLTQRLSKAMLCSSRELGFSTRILLMSSTPNCSSRASSGGETRSQHRALQHPPSSPEPKRPGMLCGAQPEALQSSPPSPSEHGRTGGTGSWDGLGLRPLCTGWLWPAAVSHAKEKRSFCPWACGCSTRAEPPGTAANLTRAGTKPRPGACAHACERVHPRTKARVAAPARVRFSGRAGRHGQPARQPARTAPGPLPAPRRVRSAPRRVASLPKRPLPQQRGAASVPAADSPAQLRPSCSAMSTIFWSALSVLLREPGGEERAAASAGDGQGKGLWGP